MYAKAHLQVALSLVKTYQGETPFVHHLRQYFTTHKKHGSRDRKQIAQLCYCWFRLGHAWQHLPAEERMIAALFLCSGASNPLLAALAPEFNEKAAVPVAEKLGLFPEPFTPFPWTGLLSEGIDPVAFSLSHLQQPDLFLRIRPGFRDAVLRKLNKIGQSYTLEGDDALRLPNGFPAEDHFVLNREVVVQDLNSQRVGELLDLVSGELRSMDDARMWDCCAASGGKTLLAFDRVPGMQITVTDIRNTILLNLFQRFRQAGIYSYNGFVADLSQPGATASQERLKQLPQQHLVITDVPCSGSGTWSRTPEQLCFFQEPAIATYSSLQKKIAANAATKLAPGAYLLYITCSVFRQENEEVLDHLVAQAGLEVLQSRVLAGYHLRADTMFAALLRRRN